jgi:hypothetical protein
VKMEEMVSSVVNVGDKIKVYWPNDDGSTDKVLATVTAVEKCSKIKQNSQYKYTLRFHDTDEEVERSTRLLHLKWKKLSKKQKQNHNETTECAAPSSPNNDECPPTKKKQKRAENGKKDVKSSDTGKLPTSQVLPTHSRIVAPMVGGSELAFRLLCR